jgi:hypothetical protein
MNKKYTSAIDAANDQVLYAGTLDGGVFKTTNGGASWNAVNTGITNANSVYALAIDPTNSQILYAGTGNGIFELVQPEQVYRFYNAQTSDHFYRINDVEKNFVLTSLPQYYFESIAYYAYDSQQDETSPVYRFYNTQTGGFFYTISENEKNYVLQNYPQYQLNGIAFYAYGM